MRKSSKKSDYQYWLYSHRHENPQVFMDYVSTLVRDTNLRMNLLMVISKKPIFEELAEWMPENFTVEMINTEPVFTIRVVKETKTERRATALATIVKYKQNLPVYLVISDSKTGIFKEVIAKLMDKHFPSISRVFLTNSELHMIFSNLEESTNYRIQVKSSVGKKRLPGENKRESQVTYTDLPYSEVFEQIEAQDQWVQSVRYYSKREPGSEPNTEFFSGLISRSGFFSIRRNSVPLFKTIIPLAIKYASARNAYLRVREEKASNPKPEPIVVKFAEDIFADISKNKQFVDALVEMDSSSISEYHSNPYIHLSLLDYLDGSSYDIWVVSANRIVIIPEFRASAGSMTRLLNHIFERVKEGEIEDYEQAKITS